VVFLYGRAALASSSDRFHHGASRVAEASVVYRPRHPERTPFYQLFERHFDRYLGEYE